MPWLSDVPINPLRRRGRDMLASPYVTHGMVCQSLVGSAPERALWRLESDTRRAHLVVLTQSRPSWAHVIEQAGWQDADGAQARVFALEPLLALIAVGRRFSFKARLNPTRATQQPDGDGLRKKLDRERAERGGRTRGARIAQRTADQQTQWLLSRSAKDWGFEIPSLRGSLAETGFHDVVLSERRTVSFRKGREGPRVTLSTATFVGHLAVTEPDKFRKAVLGGIGRGKAYGCGLITLGAPGELHADG